MFDLHCIPDGSTVFVVSSDTDQTTCFIEEILRVKADIPHTVMFSKDRPYSAELMKQEILDRQFNLFSERHTHPDRDRRLIAVFDNCFLDGSWTVDRSMHPLFHMGRSLSMTSLFGLSHIGGIPPSRRYGIDLLFVGPLQEIEQKRIHDQFMAHCSLEEFSKRLEEEIWVVIRLDVAESVLQRVHVQ
jgi:hypothetical protein